MTPNEKLERIKTGITVRRAIASDAQGIHEAHMKSIQEICSKFHSEQEVNVWGKRPFREDQRVNAIKNDLVWVVDDCGRIEGYGHLKIFERDGEKHAHIMGLYLTSKVVGKSFGKAIMDLMLEEMIAAKVNDVSLESTINGQEFYKRYGFASTGPEQTLEIAGVPIRCYPMKMQIC